jgi:hypothetical protein
VSFIKIVYIILGEQKMKKKIMACCLLINLFLVAIPATAQVSLETQPIISKRDIKDQAIAPNERQTSPIRTGYLLLLVFTYSFGKGISPYQGANVTVKSLFHSYNGTTDENGVCAVKVQAPLLREKTFFVKVSIVRNDRVVSKRAVISMQALEIAYRSFLFLAR